ncbi:MAG TPA: elongation factor P [Candidatus Paceibacterota bacterium]|mgnify:FL=1|nr:elongation factor P [Candidatus Paceibacterota bacterium]HOK97162.1 elongation factor P [Candidatus Paceibacterota bacterium]HPP64647.1 elongation factor P [Candidatus Paceibacterota bacterium]
MVSTSEFKKGMVIEVEGEPYLILDYQFVKPGKGTAFVRTTLKHVKTKKVLEKSFRSQERFEELNLDYKKVSYLYSDRQNSVFLDKNNQRISVPLEMTKDKIVYLKPKSEVQLVYLEDELIDVKIPIKITLKVVESPPAIKGDTVTGATKTVTLETGLKINVPIFIKEGEEIVVNTETNEYVERA